MDTKTLTLIVFVYCSCSKFTSTVDLYAADHHLDELSKAEAALIRLYTDHLQSLQTRLNTIRENINQYAEMHETFHQNPRNPLSSYFLLKRLTLDWNSVENSLKSNSFEELSNELNELREKFRLPVEDDLKGAIRSLIRIRNVYNLKVDSFADGNIRDFFSGFALSYEDCAQIGMTAFEESMYKEAKLWIEETLEKVKIDEICKSSSIDCTNAIEKFEILLKEIDENLNSNKTTTQSGRHFLEDFNEFADNSSSYEAVLADDKFRMFVEDFTRFKKICRGEVRVNDEYQSKLKCRYERNNNPFLLIAPVKLEEAFLDPTILIYHDVISENEMQIMKELSANKFERGKIFNSSTGKGEEVDYRLSEITNFNFTRHPSLAAIKRRVEDLSSLSADSADRIQIHNYGIGGHFEPHYDYFGNFLTGDRGDRMTSHVFYIGDASVGGETVFPRVNVTVYPQRGSALFWYNLRTSGRGDTRSIHASCPVLRGSKWIASVWLREKGNELLRLCDPRDAYPVSSTNPTS